MKTEPADEHEARLSSTHQDDELLRTVQLSYELTLMELAGEVQDTSWCPGP